MDPYLHSAYQIFRAGRFTDSYKFALARSMVRLARQLVTNDLIIRRRDLAQCFLEYYWPLETTYHLRQGTDPDKDPPVMVRIRRLIKEGLVEPGASLVEFQRRSPEECGRLLAIIQQDAFDDSIPRFHAVRGKNVFPVFYGPDADIGGIGSGIKLTAESKAALIDYGQVIDYMALGAWVEFTERFTSAPRLFEKLSGARPSRLSLTKWKPTLDRIQKGRCFYCNSVTGGRGEIDYALPWSFVLEDRTWNLVLACRPCNSAKRDRLADTATMKRLVARNKLVAKIEAPDGNKFLRHYDEWQSRDLSGHIMNLYDQARQDGFPVWVTPLRS